MDVSVGRNVCAQYGFLASMPNVCQKGKKTKKKKKKKKKEEEGEKTHRQEPSNRTPKSVTLLCDRRG